MRTDQFLQYLDQGLFLLIFVATAIEAVRRPARVKADIALFFGVCALLILEAWLFAALHVRPGSVLIALTSSALMALPYLLLRLVNDFSTPPRWVLRAAEAGLALSVAGLFLFAPALPPWLILLLTLYFCVFSIYSALAFFREARRAGGVTRRRMQAVAAGSGLLGLAILLAGVAGANRSIAPFVNSVVYPVLTIAAGLAYFVGFATPPILRRAWQEPELRAFLAKAASLPRLPDTATIAAELERGAATSLGAPHAAIGLWDEHDRVLRFPTADRPVALPAGQMIAGRAFAGGRPLFSADAAHDDPEHAARYRAGGATAILAAPITAGDKRLGVLTVYAPRAPIFADEDLRLVQLLADQAAVIFESRALIDEAARVRAREEATRLKDDFLSAAAHDLKTPLTTLVASAELLQRRAERNPAAPPDLNNIQRLVREARRLNGLVVDLLDASRVEQGRLLGPLERVDLVELAREVIARHAADRHRFVLDAAECVAGEYDRTRIDQLVENLLENAVKYSPDGGEVRVTIWREEGDVARLSVADEGIGIPAADLAHIFERFHRAANVDDRRFAGLGLGLYICRGIVEQHGGRIWATSEAGRGATFHVALPALPAEGHRGPVLAAGEAREGHQ